MTAQIIPFPKCGPFAIHIVRDGAAWLVICRDHGWIHGNLNDAIDDATAIADGFGVAMQVRR